MLSPLTLDNYSRTNSISHAKKHFLDVAKYTYDQREMVFSSARSIPPTPPRVTKAL